MLFYFGIALVGVGALGVVFKTVEFVRVTIPSNYGLNPGFGAYETMTAPWWAAMCLGLGVVVSWKAGLALFALGLFGLGFVAQLLGWLFGGVERG